MCSTTHSEGVAGEAVSEVQKLYKPEIDKIYESYEYNKARKQSLIGTVVSIKCPKSITVKILGQTRDLKYQKFTDTMKKVMAHDPDSLGKMGDLVRIVPCRPMSRRKRHILMDIVKRPESVVTSDGSVFTTAGRMGR